MSLLLRPLYHARMAALLVLAVLRVDHHVATAWSLYRLMRRPGFYSDGDPALRHARAPRLACLRAAVSLSIAATHRWIDHHIEDWRTS